MICEQIHLPLDDRFAERLIDMNLEHGTGEIIDIVEYVPATEKLRYGHFITNKGKKRRWRADAGAIYAFKTSRTLR